MRQWTGSALVQVMVVACSAPSHYLNQCWLIVNWTFRDKLLWNSNRNSNVFIEENAIENVVCNFPAKLSRGAGDVLTGFVPPTKVKSSVMLPQAMKCDIKGLKWTQHFLKCYPPGSFIKWFKHTAVHFISGNLPQERCKEKQLEYTSMWFLREVSKGIYTTSNNNISGGQIGKHYLIAVFIARL